LWGKENTLFTPGTVCENPNLLLLPSRGRRRGARREVPKPREKPTNSLTNLKKRSYNGKQTRKNFAMTTKPPVHAFFLGRALAEALYEQLENTVTNALSNLGKFDAEQREWLRQFTEQVVEKATQQEERVMHTNTASGLEMQDAPPEDLQATIDELRAEVAELKSELKRHRANVQ
jgi:polyhydroxyalkanoate synthesis regulator phasin